MPATLGPAISARLPLPDVIERAKVNTLTCPLYNEAGLVAPTSGTITIRSAGGTIQVDATAVAITASIATYTYTPAAELALSEGWSVEWVLVTADYGTVTIRNEALLVRVRLTCPVTEQDLYAVAKSLNASVAGGVTSDSGHGAYIVQAWEECQRRLIATGGGRRPYLITGAHALFDYVRASALALIFANLSHRNREVYGEIAAEYETAAYRAWQRTTLKYDENDDGNLSAGRAPAQSASTWWM